MLRLLATHVTLFLLLGSWVGVVAAQEQTDPPTIIDLGYAQYQGIFNSTSNTTNLLGIRYAAPPVGESSPPLPLDAHVDPLFRKLALPGASTAVE